MSLASPLGGARAACTELTLGRGQSRGRRPVGAPTLLGPAPWRPHFRPPPGSRGLPRSQGSASGGQRSERPVAPSGCALGRRLAFSFLGPGLQGETLPGRARPLPGFQGGRSPGVLFPGGDRRPFWARSEGSVCEPRGARALPYRGGSGAGPGGISCGKRGFPALPLGVTSIQNRFRAPPWPGPGSAGLLRARAGLWVARRGKHAKTTGREPALFLGCVRLFSPLLRVNQKE